MLCGLLANIPCVDQSIAVSL